ncbi:hypothetical protein G7046_g8761 [Stylonectria norvegica]|nr:hypothetical protein G7046_g8761 [Stylonectria norvegica]
MAPDDRRPIPDDVQIRPSTRGKRIDAPVLRTLTHYRQSPHHISLSQGNRRSSYRVDSIRTTRSDANTRKDARTDADGLTEQRSSCLGAREQPTALETALETGVDTGMMAARVLTGGRMDHGRALRTDVRGRRRRNNGMDGWVPKLAKPL